MSRFIGLLFAVLLMAALPLAADEKKDDKKKTEQKSDAKPSSASDYTPIGEVSGVLGTGPGKSGNSITLRGAHITLQGTYRRANFKAVEEKQVIDLTPDVKVRVMQPPPRADGKKTPYSEKELRELKGDANLKGYKADVEDLKPGLAVTVHLVKLKGAKGENAEKLFADRVYINGESKLQLPPEKSGKDKKDK